MPQDSAFLTKDFGLVIISWLHAVYLFLWKDSFQKNIYYIRTAIPTPRTSFSHQISYSYSINQSCFLFYFRIKESAVWSQDLISKFTGKIACDALLQVRCRVQIKKQKKRGKKEEEERSICVSRERDFFENGILFHKNGK